MPKKDEVVWEEVGGVVVRVSKAGWKWTGEGVPKAG